MFRSKDCGATVSRVSGDFVWYHRPVSRWVMSRLPQDPMGLLGLTGRGVCPLSGDS